jgi:hypothetical protein
MSTYSLTLVTAFQTNHRGFLCTRLDRRHGFEDHGGRPPKSQADGEGTSNQSDLLPRFEHPAV